MSKSLVIFDLYNTLIVDSSIKEQSLYRVNSMWSAIEKGGFPIRFNEVVKAYEETIEIMVEEQKKHFSVSVFELVNIFAQKINMTDISYMKKFYNLWSFASLQFSPKPINHIKEGLEELKANNKKIALISNTGTTPGVALRFLLKELEVYDLFDDMIFSDEFGFMKPNAMIFNRVLERLDTEPKDAVFVGDHIVYDKQGANAVGISYIPMNPDIEFRKVIKEIIE